MIKILQIPLKSKMNPGEVLGVINTVAKFYQEKNRPLFFGNQNVPGINFDTAIKQWDEAFEKHNNDLRKKTELLIKVDIDPEKTLVFKNIGQLNNEINQIIEKYIGKGNVYRIIMSLSTELHPNEAQKK